MAQNRLVTLCGTGGVGKTRLAIQIASASELRDGLCFVDLAPITESGIVAATAARAVGLPDQPGRSTMDSLRRFIGNRRMLMVLDNCEHLLDACAALVVELLGACPELTILATSREPIGMAGEITWRVPSMSITDEAVELFADRASRVQPGFTIANHNAAAVGEICRRLDGIPLAIEFAAARVRSMSPLEIADGLDDCFRLLAGGVRGAVQRQQTLRASIDWSHALLTETGQILFRRLAPFVGGFDLAAVRAVAAGSDLDPFSVLDQLTLLVDKSLVVADDCQGRTRYRLLETVRRYALEKLGDSGEADVHARHRDYYTALAARVDNPGPSDYSHCLDQAETEIDNLRAAFVWNRENSDTEGALALASSLLRVWMTRGRIQEGRAWFDSILADENARHLEVAAAVRARALADKALLDIFVDAAAGMEQAQQALVIAREVDEPALLSRALTACGLIAVAVARADAAASYFAEAIDLARAVDDRWRLAQILTFQAVDAVVAGDPVAARPAAQEARELAAAIGDHSNALWCRWCLGYAQLMRGELAAAAAQFGEVVDEAEASQEVLHKANSLQGLAFALAYQGELSAARAAADAALEAAELGEYFAGMGYSALTTAALAAGDVQTAQHASEAAWRNLSLALPLSAAVQRAFNAQAALAGGDLSAARRWCDDAVQSMTGHHLAMALATRARIAVAEGKREEAERDAHKALACAAESGAHLDLPDVLECLAGLASDAGTHHAAARLFGAAEAIRQQIGSVRFAIYRSDYVQSVTALRDAMGEKDFDAAWAEGAALSIKETIAYAQRGHSWRKRPATGWESLTPTEIDVVRLVGEGLANKDIATRLFVSPRTVQTHLTHVYTKLGFTSRLQLAQAAARRT